MDTIKKTYKKRFIEETLKFWELDRVIRTKLDEIQDIIMRLQQIHNEEEKDFSEEVNG